MAVTDPIADMLTRIRNGQMAKKDVVQIPASKIKIGIAHVLKNEGFIRGYKCIRDNKQGILKVALNYNATGDGVIRKIQRMSSPGLRVYKRSDDLPYVKNGYGSGVYSTSRGLMTDHECRKSKVGGEYLLSVF
jgi:small subunit ribosomal protein S8